ncbi:binding-protein-dependent transport systems inner membrane component [Gloeocapsa sp. PCC 7428]|uniref:ABC transporter permease n=1 Tax=Gloeocapsa sp. PCC 7428 TaxID=1173026 RepID=UPI0002A5BDAC|nr:ABC transporter permease [Gloeocapsa sp. PCC 7428]AFZ30978.1 binding-protein-dependent transport systems inner membrane component [Gloeocapsa sp. PCC 7428]
MKQLLGGLTILVYLFMYLPILVIVVFSFSQGRVLALPIQGWTVDWYNAALSDDRLQAGLFNSIRVAIAATSIAAILGTLAAFAIQKYQFFGKNAFRTAAVLPIILPGIVTGVAMLSFFSTLDVPLGLLTVIIGHATFGFPVVFNTVAARISQLPRSLEEAAADLGASPWAAFWRVVFPGIRSALISGTLLAFTLSFDEIIVTIFLTGQDNTLPMEIWARLRFGITPEINATVTLILVFSICLVLLSQKFARE